jgi:glycosyltransferase involved in cell wall biosynthesis
MILSLLLSIYLVVMHKRMLIVANDYSSPYFKREGVFTEQDEIYFRNAGYEVHLLILNRYILSPKSIFKKQNKENLKNHISFLKEKSNTENNFSFSRYFSLPKPYVDWEDLFLSKRIVRKFSNSKYDLVLCEFSKEAGLIINYLRRNIKAKQYVLREHSDWLRYKKHMKRVIAKKVSTFDLIFANSYFLKNRILEVFKSEQLHKHANILVDYPKIRFNKIDLLKEPNQEKVFLTVANIIVEKGYKEIVNLLSALSKRKALFKWYIIGKGPYKNELIQILKELNIYDKVIFLEEKAQKELAFYYQKADIYIQLSYNETFGIAPLEAFNYNCKLIISDVFPSIKELIITSNNILSIPISKIDKFLEYNFDSIVKFIDSEYDYNDYDSNITSIVNKINECPLC